MSGAKIHDVAETTAVADRLLRDGTLLRYQLTVLQQPMRARACGMGAKSHADRRPVDPPPVIELKIFSGTGDERSDITFSHNSNFFLFATLEQARPIAQGRGMPAPAPAPVLTGVPVSGMAYLDRPKPAGYFIFPDLSVRHEGKYRLRFSLYEETKDRDEMPQPAREGEPREFAAHRIEVKSKPFTVFSAKKFPGLAESTALSRIVAEQGCRVRIRRDVRMRRRSDRPGRDDSEVDETAQLRAQRRAASPDGYDHDMRGHGHHQPQQHPHAHPQPSPHSHHLQRSGSEDRKRSSSDASIASMAEVPAPPRFDLDRYAPRQEHHPYGVTPPGPQNNSHQHLSFGSNNTIHHPAPPPNLHQPQVYNGHVMQPRYSSNAPVAQHPQQSPRLAPAPRPQSMQNGQYGPAPQPYHRDSMQVRRTSTSQEYQAAPNHTRRESDQYRQPHVAPYRPTTPSVPSQGAQYQMDAYNNAPAYKPPQPVQYHTPAPAQPTVSALPSLKLPPLAIEPKVWEGRTVNTSVTSGPTAAPLQSPSTYPPPPSAPQHLYQPQYSSYPPPPLPPQTYVPAQPTPQKPVARPVDAPPRGTKREWGRVFNDSHVAEPLHNGKRPDTISETSTYGEDPVVDEDDDFDIGKLKMTYRRADGEEIVRRLPLEE